MSTDSPALPPVTTELNPPATAPVVTPTETSTVAPLTPEPIIATPVAPAPETITVTPSNPEISPPPITTHRVELPEFAQLLRGQHRISYRDRYLEVEELLEYAATKGCLSSPELAYEVKRLKKIFFYQPLSVLTLEELCEAEAELEKVYAQLAIAIAPASIETLRATSSMYAVQRPWWTAWLLGSGSVCENFMRQLFWVAVGLMILMGAQELLGLLLEHPILKQDPILSTDWRILHDFLGYIDPFLYGAIGAWIYLYRTLSTFYAERVMHPAKLSTDWLRLFMGTLAGGLVVQLFGQMFQDMQAYSAAAVGFLAGYSTEFFYQFLDRVIRAMFPKEVGTANSVRPAQIVTPPPSRRQTEMEALIRQLKAATTEEEKQTIRNMLEKL